MTSFANMPPQDEVEVEESDNASENEYETKDERDEESMPDASIKGEVGANGGEGPDVKKPKLDPKDPLRPRRKKARRACFACQRAHLTCGMFQTLRVLSSARFIQIFIFVVVLPALSCLVHGCQREHHDNAAY